MSERDGDSERRPFSLTLVAAPCRDPTGPVLLLAREEGEQGRETPTGEGTPNVATRQN